MTERIVKLIHPKTLRIREVSEANENKFAILKRAGFILFADYKPPKPKKDVPEPTLAEVVEEQREKAQVGGKKVAAEVADHEDVKLPESLKDEILVSKAAAEMIEDNELDLGMLTGTGKDGKITKTDVEKFLDDRVLSMIDDQEAPGEEQEEDEGNVAEDHEGDGLGEAGAPGEED